MAIFNKKNVYNHEVTLFESVADAADSIISSFDDKPIMLTALNPEKVEKARKSTELREVLQSSDVLYADGIGIVKSINAKFKVKTSRIPGCELWEAIVKVSREKDLKIYLVGARPEVLEDTVNTIHTKYQANIVGFTNGMNLDELKTISDIKSSGADFVSVALGTPKQELFIMKCREMGVKAIMMGVGGTYDVFTGNVKRAPSIWIKLKLEWLYRLLSEPTRIWRQLNLIKFLYRLILKKY